MLPAQIELSDGYTQNCYLLGAPLEFEGELILTTGMTGYSEAITDPSYYGQILLFTYPLIGNYGISHSAWLESESPKVKAILCSELSSNSNHWQSSQNLEPWLIQNNIPCITEVNTRALAKRIRNGSTQVVIKALCSQAQGKRILKNPSTEFVIPEVSTEKVTRYGKGIRRIALLDLGVKKSILSQLINLECEVIVVPWNYDLNSVDCNGWVISNGPGDPAQNFNYLCNFQKQIKHAQNIPILGICLGHQILALATGGVTKRMAFGHRGHNHPVIDLLSGKAYISSQNHGYEVTSISDDWNIWFKNANDHSIEGLVHKEYPWQTVQFHPEGSCGPSDTSWIFQKFKKLIEG